MTRNGTTAVVKPAPIVGAKKRGRPAIAEELPVLNLRVPQELIDEIDRVARDAGTDNRSHVVRTLLYQVLTDEPSRANVVQVIFDFGNYRLKLLRRIAARFAKVAPKLVEDVLREAIKETAE